MGKNRTERTSDSTKKAERAEAEAPHQPDRMPTPEEERAAGQAELDPEVARRAKEMAERGARQKGEGRLP